MTYNSGIYCHSNVLRVYEPNVGKPKSSLPLSKAKLYLGSLRRLFGKSTAYTEVYREAYECQKAKPKTIRAEASKLANHPGGQSGSPGAVRRHSSRKADTAERNACTRPRFARVPATWTLRKAYAACRTYTSAMPLTWHNTRRIRQHLQGTP